MYITLQYIIRIHIVYSILHDLATKTNSGCSDVPFQGYAAQDTTLGKCILGLLDTEPHIETGTLPLLERFRGTLRLMFNPETR